MAILWRDVVEIAPELAAAPAGTETGILKIVDRQVFDANLGARADDARRYLAAHLATLAVRRGNGMITAESVGALSRSYYAPNWLKSSLGLTPYGMEYRRLVRLTFALGMVP